MRKLPIALAIAITTVTSLGPRAVGASSQFSPAPAVAAGVSLLSNGSFEQPGTSWRTPWVFMVASPAVAMVSQDSSTSAAGRYSARTMIAAAVPGTSWDASLAQWNLSLTAGLSYTFSFWAKGSFGEQVNAVVQQQASPWTGRATQTFNLTSSWQQFTETFTAPVTESGIKVQFNLAQVKGIIWIDTVSLTAGGAAPASISTPLPVATTQAPTATSTATAVPPTATSTAVPPTATSTATAVPPTATSTATSVPPTATAKTTAVPSTSPGTATVVPPTASSTSTVVPPTASSTSTVVPPTATGTSAPAGSVQDFPRLASLYAYGLTSQAADFSRYGEVVAPASAGSDGAVQAFKSQNPTGKIVLYLDSSAVNYPGFDGMNIYPGWWLTLAGTTLSESLDAASTTVHVVNAAIIDSNLSSSPDVLVDGETMHVLSVDTSANTLTVQRGYYSIASSHATGARLAAHASNWSGSWMLNVTPYCPTDPTTGLTWDAALARQAKSLMSTGPWDGIFFDNANNSWASFQNGQLDANNDNTADGGNGPSGTGWSDGETNLFNLTRTLAPGALLLDNGGSYPGLIAGQELEHFPLWQGYWTSGLSTYLQLTAAGPAASATILNADTSDTGSQDLQSMRFNLGTALMGNGYYAYDYGSDNHGQLWWYDEYDNGAGSSLTSAIDASQTSFSVAPGTGSKFSIGSVVHVPDPLQHLTEQMLVTAINGDTLTVVRGYNGTQVDTHPATSSVATAAQMSAGQGWLGQPLAAASTLGVTGLLRRDFSHGTVLVNGSTGYQTVTIGPGYRHIAGSQDPATNNGAVVTSVTLAPQTAMLLVKTS